MGQNPERAGAGRRRPYAQGDLDGLCGVYAVINAVYVLVPGLTEAKARRLFQVLLKGVRAQDTGPVPLAARGLAKAQLERALLDADQYVRRQFGGRLVVGRVPKADARAWSLATLWRLLDRRLGKGWVAILGLGGVHDHWTLALRVTPETIRLFDSGRLRVLRRRNCTVSAFANDAKRHLISSQYVIFLRWMQD